MQKELNPLGVRPFSCIAVVVPRSDIDLGCLYSLTQALHITCHTHTNLSRRHIYVISQCSDN